MAEELLYGLKEDFLNIIVEHSNKKTYDFNDFIDTWNDMKYYYIFSGRKDVGEMKFFMEHGLMIIKNLFLRPGNIGDLERAAAFFLLYTFFTSQPLQEKVKIRIELDEFKEMSNYVSSLKAYSKDIPFAFATLILKDAFHYVFSYQKKIPEKTGVVDVRHFDYQKESSVLNSKEKARVTELLDFLNFNIENWKHLEESYNLDISNIQHRFPSTANCFGVQDFIKELKAPNSDVPIKTEKRVRKSHTRFTSVAMKGTDAPVSVDKSEEGCKLFQPDAFDSLATELYEEQTLTLPVIYSDVPSTSTNPAVVQIK